MRGEGAIADALENFVPGSVVCAGVGVHLPAVA